MSLLSLLGVGAANEAPVANSPTYSVADRAAEARAAAQSTAPAKSPTAGADQTNVSGSQAAAVRKLIAEDNLKDCLARNQIVDRLNVRYNEPDATAQEKGMILAFGGVKRDCQARFTSESNHNQVLSTIGE